MNDNRYLRAAAALVGVLILTFTFLDYTFSVWPFEIGSLPWRFGAMTTLSGSLLTPAIGVLVLFAAVSGRRRWPKISIAVFLGLFGLLLMAGLAVFILDVLQLRSGVRVEVVGEYDVIAGRTLTKLTLGALATLLFSFLAFRAARRQNSQEPHKQRTGAPLIRRQSPPAASEQAPLQSAM